jgi:GT2 family glycosyltransferase
MVRRAAIDEIGLMDENYFLYDEEVDWCKRMKDKGWEIFFTPHAQIIHYGGQSTKQDFRKNIIQSYRARQQYFEKYYGKVGAFASKTIFGFGVLLRLIACIPSVVLGEKNKKEARERFKFFAITLKWYFCG